MPSKKKTSAKSRNPSLKVKNPPGKGKTKAAGKTALQKPGKPQTKGSVERGTKAANRIPENVVKAPKGKPITVSDPNPPAA